MLIARETADNYLQYLQTGVCVNFGKSSETSKENILQRYLLADISKCQAEATEGVQDGNTPWHPHCCTTKEVFALRSYYTKNCAQRSETLLRGTDSKMGALIYRAVCSRHR